LSAILIAVRNDVMRETQRKQVPWEHSALTARFYFAARTEDKPPLPDARPSQDAPEITTLFSSEDMQRVKDTAERKQIPLPSFQIYKPVDGISDSMRRFVGIWISDRGNDQTGRQWGLIVTDVTVKGRATGYTLFGPPKANSVQTPASHYPFVGQISESKLIIEQRQSKIVAEYKSQHRIVMTETWNNGIQGSALLKPVWQLVEAERSTKR
jgi:hypothetical protein